MSAAEVEQFADGSLRVTAQPWFLVGDGPLRVPVNENEVFDGVPHALEASAQEVADVFGPTELRRLAAAQAAATCALLYAGGAAPAGLRLLSAPQPAFELAPSEPGDAVAVPVLIAAVLAGQLAKGRALRAAEPHPDPLRLVAASMFGGQGLAQLPTLAAEPVALLYGPIAIVPEQWPGRRAVHMDHLYEQTRAWITEHAGRIDALAEQAFIRASLEADAIEQVLSGPGASEPVQELAPDHPLRRPTEISPEAVAAVADYWSAVLRRTLASSAAYRPPAQSARPDDDAGPTPDEQCVEVFRSTLAEQIATRIERREQRGDRRIEQRLYEDESYMPFTVGVHYQPDSVIQDALDAAGLEPSPLIALLTQVEFDRDTVTVYRHTGAGRSGTILWQAGGEQARTATD
jgi:hypothetical protein